MLNDVGPEIDPAGIERIGGYVGQDTRFTDVAAVAAALKERNGAMFPKLDDDGWQRFARRVSRDHGGDIGFDYDMAIADNFRVAAKQPPVTAWPYFQSLAERPVTILRGALSDLLSAGTAERMAAEIPGAELVTVPDVGHAPTLEEPESLAALDRLLARVIVAA